MASQVGFLGLDEGLSLDFTEISDVASDGAGRLYALTRHDSHVVVFSEYGASIGSWPLTQLVNPHSIEFDPVDCSLLVVDEGNHVVHTFSRDGVEIGPTLGEPGQPADTGLDWTLPAYADRYRSITRGAPPFNRPTHLAITADGRRLVTDGYGNARLHVFDRAGTLIQSWGEPGSGPGEFRLPHGVCELPDGRIVVADRENDRLQVFDASGRYVDQWDHVQRPGSLLFHSSGVIIVGELSWNAGGHSFRLGRRADFLPSSLAILDLEGRVVGRVAGVPGPGINTPGIWSPHGLAEMTDGRVVVAQATPYGAPEQRPQVKWMPVVELE